MANNAITRRMKNEVDNGKGGIALEAGVVLKMQGICMTFPGVKSTGRRGSDIEKR